MLLKRLVVWLVVVVLAVCVGVDAQADGHFWWLKTTISTPPTTTTTPEAVYCECVKYFLCIDGVISTSGENLIDIRMSATDTPPVTNVDTCPNLVDVCCGVPEPPTTTTSRPTLPPDTPCECVPFVNCTGDRLVSDGGGNTTLEMLDILYSHSQCPQVLSVCCALDPTTEPPNSTTVANFTATASCVCVESFQCEDGHIITSGAGLIDVRTAKHSHIASLPDGSCSDPDHVCCLPPEDGTFQRSNNSETITTTTATTTTPSPREEVAPSCGTRNSDGVRARILGFHGGESQFGEFPWVSAVLTIEQLMGKTIRRFVGGGTLIHPRVIVTAAHKVQGYLDTTLMVRLGEWDTQTEIEPLPHQDLMVQKVVLHPRYHPRTLYHDIALLFLKEEVQFCITHQKGPFCIAQDFLHQVDHLAQAQESGTPTPHLSSVTGFTPKPIKNYPQSGKMEMAKSKAMIAVPPVMCPAGIAENGEYQKIMKSVTLPLVNYSDCVTRLRRTRLGRYFQLHKSFTCAGGEKDKDACKGDGGGPLACQQIHDPKRYLLVGMTAWGIGCGEDGVPGVYVNIPEHYDWIIKNINDHYPTTTTSTTTAAPTTAHGFRGLRYHNVEGNNEWSVIRDQSRANQTRGEQQLKSEQEEREWQHKAKQEQERLKLQEMKRKLQEKWKQMKDRKLDRTTGF
nr:venom prothrombin activator vestarin-D1-like [Cherax quadricarinatus]